MRKVPRLLLCAATAAAILLTGCAARPQRAAQSGSQRQVAHAAVYLTPQTGGQLSSVELAAHPEIAIVHSRAELESAVVTRTAIWIDKELASVVEQDWVLSRVERRYPLLLVGYGSPDYAFRVAVPVLPGNPGGSFFLSEAKQLRKVQGFSAYMITSEKRTPTSYRQMMYLEGFETTPTVAGVLKVSNDVLRMPHR